MEDSYRVQPCRRDKTKWPPGFTSRSLCAFLNYASRYPVHPLVDLSVIEQAEQAWINSVCHGIIMKAHHRKTIAVLTPVYIVGGSGWTEFENILVQTLDPAARQRRLIPLLLEQCAPPVRLNSLTFIDFTQSAKHEERLQRLVSVIQQRLAPRGSRAATAPLSLPFEVPTGTLASSSPVYIERKYDRMLQQQVAREGSTTHVEGARQMGKSSLLQQAVAHAGTRRYAVVDVDFQTFDEQHLDRLDTLLRYLADPLQVRLKIPASPNDIWQGPLGAKDKLTSYLGDQVLQGVSLPTVLVLDEVDRVFGRNYQNDFFGLLRS